MTEVLYDDPQDIVDKVDAEGWPDALGWLITDTYEDETLTYLIKDAYTHYDQLNKAWEVIKDRLADLGVDVYI